MLCSFASRVREGSCGRGHQVRVGSVKDALCAVGKRCELADPERRNPLYKLGTEKYFEALSKQLRGYEREDPKTQPQLAVPVALPKQLVRQALRQPHNLRKKAKADLINVAFYYLLRVGEYTKPHRKDKLTVPFRVADVTFRRRNRIIPVDSPIEDLLQADSATLCIANQKNGQKGQTIHHEATYKLECPIKSLARRVHHVFKHSGSTSTPLYWVYEHPHKKPYYISPNDITKEVRRGAQQIGLFDKSRGYTKSDISSHSLRAGGAMAMHLKGVSSETIQKIGRWKYRTFLMYVHEQISAFSQGLSTKMSDDIEFESISPATLSPPSGAAAA